MYIVEFQNRVMVFIQWGFEYLTFSRGARLITGTAATDSIKQAGSVRTSGECT
jgi:NADH dehydrogenase